MDPGVCLAECSLLPVTPSWYSWLILRTTQMDFYWITLQDSIIVSNTWIDYIRNCLNIAPMFPLGTNKERGLAAWTANFQKEGATMEDKRELEKALKSYDIPFTNLIISKPKWTKFIPICPTYKRDHTSFDSDNDSVKDVELQAPSTQFWHIIYICSFIKSPKT